MLLLHSVTQTGTGSTDHSILQEEEARMIAYRHVEKQQQNTQTSHGIASFT